MQPDPLASNRLTLLGWILFLSGVSTAIGAIILAAPTRHGWVVTSLLRYGPGNSNAVVGSSWTKIQEAVIERISSATVLDAAATDPSLAGLQRLQASDHPAAEIRRGVEIVGIPQTYLIAITLKEDEYGPGESKLVVDAIARAAVDADPSPSWHCLKIVDPAWSRRSGMTSGDRIAALACGSMAPLCWLAAWLVERRSQAGRRPV